MVSMAKVSLFIDKLKRVAQKEISRNNAEAAMAAISACSLILYEYNQYYCDEEIEKYIEDISKTIKIPSDYISDEKTILFYDGFGLDLRGWAASFVKALVGCDYKVVYVTNKDSSKSIPHILEELKNNTSIYIETSSYSKQLEGILEAFSLHKPKAAFFYTTPNDVAAAIVFRIFEGKVKRIQVDLTDHAFWIGVKSADCFIESRELGASLAIYERGIDKDKIIRLDCAPYINRDVCNDALPFDIENERYFFSGGSLYKTLGDPNLLFYRSIEDILISVPDIKFLYAGTGDSSNIRTLQNKYPNRVFLIQERPDYFRLIEHSIFYLNTYPMFGGLMMRYSALAKKLPITLRHNDDASGILFDQDALGIEFNSYEEYMAEIKRIICDNEYREKKESNLYLSVMNDELFRRNLQLIIEEGRSEYVFRDIPKFDTRHFRETYLKRFSIRDNLEYVISNKKNISLAKYFPNLFIKKVIDRLIRRANND